MQPTSWKLEGSLDATNWTLLNTTTDASVFSSTTVPATKVCPIASPGAYRYYRLTVTAIGTAYQYQNLDLKEFTLQTPGVYYQKSIPTDFTVAKGASGAQTITITKLAAGSAQTLIEYL